MEQKIDIPSSAFTDFLKEYVQIPFGGESAHTVVEDSAAAVTENAGQLLGDAGTTVLIGLVVVIGTLFVLTGIFYLFGFIMSGADRKAKKQAATKKEPASAPAPAASPAAPAVQSGISGEVVAAIAAAVAMMTPDGKRYAVKSIARKDATGRSAWASAGIADNTRPF